MGERVSEMWCENEQMSEWIVVYSIVCVWGINRHGSLIIVVRCVRIHVRALISTDTAWKRFSTTCCGKYEMFVAHTLYLSYSVFLFHCIMDTHEHTMKPSDGNGDRQLGATLYVFYYDVIFFILLVCDWVLCS